MENQDQTAQEYNGETGETLIRPLTDEEIAQRNLDAQEIAKMEASLLKQSKAREASIRKMAEASGLTENEIEAIL